mgnify:CR=1 FL=1
MIDFLHDEWPELIEALAIWANSHPRPDDPFMVVQGVSFSPRSFLAAAKERSELTMPFFEYAKVEAERENVSVREIIDRETRKPVP